MTTGFGLGPLRRAAPREDLVFLTRALFFGAERVARLVDVFCFLADFFAMGILAVTPRVSRRRCSAPAMHRRCGTPVSCGLTGVPGLQRIASRSAAPGTRNHHFPRCFLAFSDNKFSRPAPRP